MPYGEYAQCPCCVNCRECRSAHCEAGKPCKVQ